MTVRSREQALATFHKLIEKHAGKSLDDPTLTPDDVNGAIAIVLAEATVQFAPGAAEMQALDDEIVENELTEVFFSMPEEKRNEVRRLMGMEDGAA